MKLVTVVCASLATVLVGCAKSGIPIIGLDKNGNEVTYYVPEGDYIQNMSQVMMTTQESVYPALKQSGSSAQWRVRTLSLGLGFNFEFGIGPIIKAGVKPRLRFAFSNSKKPLLP